MNSPTLRCILRELAPLAGAAVTRVASVDEWEFRMRIGDATLTACLHPEHNALFQTVDPIQGDAAHRFSKSLAEALQGSELVEIRDSGLDRLCAFVFLGRDRLGDPVHYQLILELTSKGANASLVHGSEPWKGRIADRLRVDRSKTVHRRLAPGAQYAPPAGGRTDLLKDGLEALVAGAARWREHHPDSPEGIPIAAIWEGLGPDTAEHVRKNAANETPEALAEFWSRLVQGTLPGGEFYAPTVVVNQLDQALEYAYDPAPRDNETERKRFDAACEAAAEAHRIFRKERRRGRNAALAHQVKQALRKTDRALKAITKEKRDRRDPAELRKMGELLLANASRVAPGEKSATLEDPATGDALDIKLNPAKTAVENADLYFKKARKAERAGGAVGGREQELQDRHDELTAFADQVKELGEGEPPLSLLQRARELRIPLAHPELDRLGPREPEEDLASSLRPRRFDLGHGWEVLVGKNDKGNHVLTFELARGGDMWMHAEGCPGSHVVLRHHEKSREPSRQVLLTAAGIAAWFSKARNSAKVPVTVAEKRHVRRPRKAPVGQALVGEHKTYIVAPCNPEGR